MDYTKRFALPTVLLIGCRMSLAFRASVVCFVLIAGCQRGPDLPPVVQVSGVVTLDGNPLPRGEIQFEPDASAGGKGASAVGTIDASGHYELTTAGVKGAIIGPHVVTVTARAVPKDETDTLPMSLIPEKYSIPDSSGIKKEVTAGAPNVINIELTSKT